MRRRLQRHLHHRAPGPWLEIKRTRRYGPSKPEPRLPLEDRWSTTNMLASMFQYFIWLFALCVIALLLASLIGN